jgi:hypothetical protein
MSEATNRCRPAGVEEQAVLRRVSVELVAAR